MYLVRIPAWGLKTNQFSIDAYIWFLWRGNMDPEPYKSFEIVSGTIDRREKCDDKKVRLKKDGVEEEYAYVCLRIQATITKFWDVSQYPLDQHRLVIEVEDSKRDELALRYRADLRNCGADENFRITGWTLDPPAVTLASHHYQTTYGDPEVAADEGSTYSRFKMEVPMRRASAIYSFKVLIGLYVAVGIGLLGFFIKASNLAPRFGVGTSAIFAAIASQYVMASALPEGGQLTLAEKLHVMADVTILLSLVVSVVSLALHEKSHQRASRRLDKVAAAVIIPAYMVLNAWLIWGPAAGSITSN